MDYWGRLPNPTRPTSIYAELWHWAAALPGAEPILSTTVPDIGEAMARKQNLNPEENGSFPK